MSAIADLTPVVADDRLAKRNALVLAVAQALAGGNNTVIVGDRRHRRHHARARTRASRRCRSVDHGAAASGSARCRSAIWRGATAAASPCRSARWSARWRASYRCVAVLQGSFLLFLVGTFCGGFYAAAHKSYRFAAADTASDDFKPKAISWVLAGGVFAGIIGPQLVIFTKDCGRRICSPRAIIAQSVLAALAGLVLTQLKSPPPMPREERAQNPGRPLSEIARQPRFIVAVACGVASYVDDEPGDDLGAARDGRLRPFGHAMPTLGIQWHVLGMYAPSFITGTLIVRFGVVRGSSRSGLSLLLVSAAVGLAGSHGRAFLDRAGPARRRLEFRLHRRHHHGDATATARRSATRSRRSTIS